MDVTVTCCGTCSWCGRIAETFRVGDVGACADHEDLALQMFGFELVPLTPDVIRGIQIDMMARGLDERVEKVETMPRPQLRLVQGGLI